MHPEGCGLKVAGWAPSDTVTRAGGCSEPDEQLASITGPPPTEAESLSSTVPVAAPRTAEVSVAADPTGVGLCLSHTARRTDARRAKCTADFFSISPQDLAQTATRQHCDGGRARIQGRGVRA